MGYKTSVIIANWNGRDYLPTCLQSLADQGYRDFETILVDNGSSDGSVALTRKHFPWVRVRELPSNQGYAAANNVGLMMAEGQYIVALNNDTRADPGWLGELVRVADENPETGSVASRTCVFDQEDLIDTLGGKVCRDGMSRGAFRGRSFSGMNLGPVVPVLYPSPTAALYRRTMIEQAGFFDEDFFAYAEDTDLGLRARWLGWEAVAATGAVVHHRYSGTGGRFSAFKLHLVERNHYWVAVKNFPPTWLAGVPIYTLGRYLAQARAVTAKEGSGSEFLDAPDRKAILGALVRGTRDALAGLPGMLRKRRRIRRQRRLADAEMLALLRRHRLSFRELLDLPDRRQAEGRS